MASESEASKRDKATPPETLTPKDFKLSSSGDGKDLDTSTAQKYAFDAQGTPSANTVRASLIQALHMRDKDLLNSILFSTKQQAVIRNSGIFNFISS